MVQVGAFSVILQLRRLIVCSTSHNAAHNAGHMASLVMAPPGNVCLAHYYNVSPAKPANSSYHLLGVICQQKLLFTRALFG